MMISARLLVVVQSFLWTERLRRLYLSVVFLAVCVVVGFSIALSKYMQNGKIISKARFSKGVGIT